MVDSDSAASNRESITPAAAVSGNLPRPLTTLVGRAREIREITELLERPDVRLLVLTGPGGTGKSRLAIELAHSVAENFPDGVYFVPLAPVRDPEGVLPTIAARVGVREAGERALSDLLIAALRSRRVLLVLDNFEQIIDAAPVLIDLLSVSPELKMLVTSRAVLRLSGEFDYPVDPLSLSETDGEMARADAVELFLQRAQAVLPGFSPDESSLALVAAICRRLDGLPLAIELAAARLRHLPLTSLFERLDQRLSLLSDGARDQPARLQTMRNAIAWSYDLLDAEHQRLVQALSVFAGGFGLDGAAAVAGIDDEIRLLEGVTALVDNSLLRQLPAQDGPARFGMLEVIREFGFEQLEQAGADDEVHERLVEWCISLVEQGWPAMAGRANQEIWLARYDLELPNFRAVMARLAADRDSDRLNQLAGGMFWYWYVRGQFSEGRSWLQRALSLSTNAAADRSNVARAIYGAGILAHFQGDDDQAVPLVEEALAEWEALGNEWGQGISRLLLGIIAEDRGEYDRAIPFVEQAIEHARRADDDVNHALSTYHLGILRFGLGDLDSAFRLCEDALARQRAIGDRWGEANSCAFLGLFAALRGEYERSNEFQQESFRLRMEIGTPGETEEIANYLANMGVLAVRCDQADLTARLLGAEHRIRTEVGGFRGFPERLAFEDASARARDALGDEAFEAAWTLGYSAPIEETFAAARNFDPFAPVPHRPGDGSSAGGRHEHLTAREMEVLQQMALGLTNAEIAERLFITPGTARIHVSNVLGKLGAQNRTEAVSIARRRGDLPA